LGQKTGLEIKSMDFSPHKMFMNSNTGPTLSVGLKHHKVPAKAPMYLLGQEEQLLCPFRYEMSTEYTSSYLGYLFFNFSLGSFAVFNT
jgi:hypothetical protein